MTPTCGWRGTPRCTQAAVAELVSLSESATRERVPVCRIHAIAVLEHCVRNGLPVPSLQLLAPSGELVGVTGHARAYHYSTPVG